MFVLTKENEEIIAMIKGICRDELIYYEDKEILEAWGEMEQFIREIL